MNAHFIPSESERYDAAVAAAIASCDGDLRGAVKALLMANELLESALCRALKERPAR